MIWRAHWLMNGKQTVFDCRVRKDREYTKENAISNIWKLYIQCVNTRVRSNVFWTCKNVATNIIHQWMQQCCTRCVQTDWHVHKTISTCANIWQQYYASMDVENPYNIHATWLTCSHNDKHTWKNVATNIIHWWMWQIHTIFVPTDWLFTKQQAHMDIHMHRTKNINTGGKVQYDCPLTGLYEMYIQIRNNVQCLSQQFISSKHHSLTYRQSGY